MSKVKKQQPLFKKDSIYQDKQISGWNISEEFKSKLITWTIEGLIISAITFAILWLPLVIEH